MVDRSPMIRVGRRGRLVGVDESWSAVYLGYTHGSSLSVDGAQATDLTVTQDTDKVFIQVRRPCGRNTYVLRLIVLLWVVLS